MVYNSGLKTLTEKVERYVGPFGENKVIWRKMIDFLRSIDQKFETIKR